ncbi:MAG: tetratricopeptide repeat protein [Bacteroidales bacterium]|nr:tetratricopeptide repeat protein [Bacteroidales bacterium]
MKLKLQKKENNILFYILVTLLFFICITFSFPTFAQKNSKILSKKDSITLDIQKNKFNELFIQGNLHKNRREYTEALALYYDCLQINKSSSAVLYEIAQIHFVMQNYEEAEKAIQKAINFSPQNEDLYTFLAKIYESWNKPEKHIQTLTLLEKKHPKNLNISYTIAELYFSMENNKKAIATLKKIEKKFGTNETILRNKARYYASDKNYSSAIQELTTLISRYPHKTEYVLILANIHSLIQEYETALNLYNTVIHQQAYTDEVMIYKAELFFIQNMQDSLLHTINSIIETNSIHVETKLKAFNTFILSTSTHSNLYNARFDIAQKMDSLYPNNNEISLALANLYYETDSLQKKSKPLYYKTLSKPSIKLYTRLIELEEQDNNADSAIFIGQTAIETYPLHIPFYIAIANNYMHFGAYTQAIDLLESSLHFAFQKKSKSQIISTLARAYFKTQNIEHAETLLTQAYNLDSTVYEYRQNYAYIFAQQNKDYQHVSQLVELCMQEKPNDSKNNYISAFLLYNTQKISEAIHVLQTIIQKYPNAENVEFLGDLLYLKNETQHAIDAWNRAKELGGTIDIQGKLLFLQK